VGRYLEAAVPGSFEALTIESLLMKSYTLHTASLTGSCLLLALTAPGWGQEAPEPVDLPLRLAQNADETAGKVVLNATYSRTAFYRKEENAVLKIQVVNNTGQALPAS